MDTDSSIRPPAAAGRLSPERLARWFLLVFLVGLILLPAPAAGWPLALAKQLGLALAGAGAILFWLAGVWRRRRLILPRSPLILAPVFLAAVFLVLALATGQFRYAFFGEAFELGAAGPFVLLGLLTLATAALFRGREWARRWFLAFFIGFVGVAVAAVFRLNLIGDWLDQTIFFGLAAIISLAFIGARLTLTSRIKWLLCGLATLAILFTVSGVLFGLADRLPALQPLQNFLQAANFSVISTPAPARAETWALVGRTLRQSPLRGAGPNHFLAAWTAAAERAPIDAASGRPLDFTVGRGWVPTSVILGGVGAALAQLFFLFALGWLAVRSWRRRPSEAMAQASLVAAALAALYLWLVLWLATPGPVILALAFLFTGLWLGLATGLGQVSLGEWPISWRRTSRAILTATLLALTLGAIWLALVAGRSAAAWWRYQALLTRWFQNPAATAELWPAAERLAADYFSPAFDRAAVDLTLTELRQLSRRQGSPAELEQQFAAAARAAIGAADRARGREASDYRHWLATGLVYETLATFQVEGAASAAGEAYRQALARYPANPLIHLALARLALAGENPSAAAEPLAAAARLAPNDPAVILLSAQFDFAEGHRAAALERLVAATERQPAAGELWLALGYFRHQSADYRGAVAALTQAIRYRPDLPESHYFLGLSYAALGERESARREWRLLELADPGNAAVKAALAELEK